MRKPWHSRGWWRWLQGIAGLVVIVFVVRHLIRNWEVVRAEPVDWDFSPSWILLSLVLVLTTYAMLAESWRRMLAGWGPLLPWLDAARIWVLSSMGKYLPGKIWAIAGMAVLAERRGVSPAHATGSAILLQVVSIGTGALLVGITGMTALEAHWPGGRLGVGLVLLASVVGLAAMMWPKLAARLLSRFQRGSERVTPDPKAVGFGIVANLLAWAGYGVALWLLGRGVLPSAELGIPEAIGAFAGSYIAGLLFLLAPGGLGVREGVFVWMIQDRIGPANALVLAGVSRIGMTIADLLAALPFVLLYRDTPRE